jgi:3-carboxy-cis,cis-muconate cycloisomerase
VAAAAAEAAASGRAFAAVLGARADVRAHLPPERIAGLLDPAGYLGSAGALVDRALAARGARRAARG